MRVRRTVSGTTGDAVTCALASGLAMAAVILTSYALARGWAPLDVATGTWDPAAAAAYAACAIFVAGCGLQAAHAASRPRTRPRASA